MKMFKRILLASALFSTAALAQQVDISGKDFLSGAGDAKLADIARQAAASGKKVVVTAPKYWQDKISAKLHAGAANVSVQMSEGFFESVAVRIDEGKAAAAPKAEPPAPAAPSAVDTAKADAAKAEAARAAAAKAEAARADAARQESERADAARAEAARAEAARAEAAKAEAARAEAAKAEAARAEAAKAEAAKAATAKAAADKIAATKQRMEKNLNDGKPAEGSLNANDLKKDDLVVVDGDIRGVARRSGVHTQLFWLEGDLNLDRVELVPMDGGRYKVSEPLRGTVTLRTHEKTQNFASKVPAPDSADRKSLQQQYADGKDIASTLHPADLRQGDVIYTGNGCAVVVRRAGIDLVRYWLEGDINLGQTGLIKQGNATRVMTDTIK
jgi:hypothetical protein